MKLHHSFTLLLGVFFWLPQLLQAQSGNYFAGAGAGASNTTGVSNTFAGQLAGNKNTTGNGNSFMGHLSGYSNTTGFQNSFYGATAGLKNKGGSHNSFFGYGAGNSNTTGTMNTYFGHMAGFMNEVSDQNSFFGHMSGYHNTTGKANSFIGYYSGYSTTEGDYNLFAGYMTGYKNTTGDFNAFIGNNAGDNNTGGSYNTFVGTEAGRQNNIGSNNTMLGSYTNLPSYIGISVNNATAIGNRAYVSRTNSLVLGSIKDVNGATAHTNVGIGTSAPAYRLQVNGDAAKPGSSSWTVASDERLKKNITAFTDGLQALAAIQPVKFQYNGKAGMPTDKEYVGVIAQEVQKAAPYMVGTFIYQDTLGKEEQYLDYDATALTYILVNAVKEQQKLLEAKDAQIAEIYRELASLKALISKEEPAGNSHARLEQNIPNPYAESTSIRYQVPAGAASAFVKVYSLQGQELSSYDISGQLSGEITLAGSRFPAGTYIYKLFVNGRATDSKKLILAR